MLISAISTEALRSLVSALDQDAENCGMYGLPSFGNVSPTFLSDNAEETREELLDSLSNSCDVAISEESEVEEIAEILGGEAVTHLIEATNSQFSGI